MAKQLSVFIENRQGRLGEVLTVLKDGGVDILSVSLADTTEYGILRLIVSDAEKGKKQLAAAGFSTTTTEVLILTIPNKVGSLQAFIEDLADSGVSVEYMYGLTVAGKDASIVLKVDDREKVLKLLEKAGVEGYKAE